MRIDRWIATLVLLVSVSLVPAARAQKVEITPYAGLRLGGDFEEDFPDDFDPDLEVDDGASFGISLGFALSRDFQLELFWSHQDSELIEDQGFFSDFRLSDLEIDYYHVGVLYQWAPGQIRPFIAGSVGVTEFGTDDSRLDAETRFSMSVGGGVKIFFNQSFGLRFEARAFSTVIDEGDSDFCGRDRCHGYDDGSYFFQAEVRGGLIFAF